MAAQWNPNQSGTIGLEWFPTQVGGTALTPGRGVGITVPSTATETIENVYVGFDSIATAGLFCLDVFTAGNEIPAAVTTETFVPNSDLVNTASLWQNPVPNAVNLFAYIDNGSVSASSYITYAGSYTASGTYAAGFGTVAWPANRRVLSITFSFVGSVASSTPGRLQVIYRAGGVSYPMGTVTLTDSDNLFQFVLGELNPATSRPWTEAEVEAFDTSAGFGWQALSGKTTQMRIFDASMAVAWVPENRLAVGVENLGTFAAADGPVWETFDLTAPNTGVANWAKAASVDYLFVVRPLAPGSVSGGAAGQGSVRTFDSGLALPTGSVGYRPLLAPTGAVVSPGAVETFGMSLALDVNASATDSADGQPYIQAIGVAGGPQLVNGAAAGTYTLMRAALVAEDGQTADDDISWSIVGPGPGTIDSGVVTFAEVLAGVPLARTVDPVFLAAFAGQGYLVDITINATLAAATTYQVVWGASDSVAAFTLTTRDAFTADRGNPATYGGTTLNYDAEAPDDQPVTLSTVPDQPTSFSFSYDWYDTDNQGCNPEQIPYWTLEWEPTTLGATFSYYQIDRQIDGGAWETIGHITTEAAVQYQDKEAPFCRPVTYRIRVVRAGDLIPSVWTTTIDQTLPTPDCVYYLSSNLLDVQLAYNAGDRTVWQFPSSDEVQIAPRAGGDYQQALVHSEWRGDVFDLDLTVWAPANRAATPGPGEDRWTFDPLIALTRAAVPYICVRDRTGRRWYANVNVEEGTANNEGVVPVDVASAVVAEITATPAVVDVSVDSDVLLLDLFNRANTANIDGSLPNVGPAWDTLNFTGGTIGILAGRAYTSVADAAANLAFATGLALADGWLETTYTYDPLSVGAETVGPLVWRLNTATFDGYQVLVGNDAGVNRLKVVRLDGGVPAVYYDEPVPFVAGQTVRFRVDYLGSYARVTLDGVTLVEIIDDAFNTNTTVGFALNAAANFLGSIEAGGWPDGTTILDVETAAAVWFDARNVDNGWVAADGWPNLGTLGAAQNAATAVGGGNNLTPTFVKAGDTANGATGPGFNATDLAPIGSAARSFTVPYHLVQTIPEFSGGRTVTFYGTPTVVDPVGNKWGWTYDLNDLPTSENGWVVENVPVDGPPTGPVITAAASPGPTFVGASYNNMIYGPQVWTFVADRAGQTWQTWRNGSLLHTTDMSALGDSDSAAAMLLGRNYLFKAVQIHETALTGAEVVALHESLLSGPEFPVPEPSYTPTLFDG